MNPENATYWYIDGHEVLLNSPDILCQEFDFVTNPNGYIPVLTKYNGELVFVYVPNPTPIPWGVWITPIAPTC